MAQPNDPWLDQAWVAEMMAMSTRDVGKATALAMGYGTVGAGSFEQQLRRAQMGTETDEQRFRSFAERYMIERASTFRGGHEEEDQWTCMLSAKSAYKKIAAMGRGLVQENKALEESAQGGNAQGPTQGYSSTSRLPPRVSPMDVRVSPMDVAQIEKHLLAANRIGFDAGRRGKLAGAK